MVAPNVQHLDVAVRAGLRFVARTQLADGEVPTTVVERGASSGAKDSNYFTAALVLASLTRAAKRRERVKKRVIDRLIDFLRSGRLATGAWRFWTRKTVRLVDADTDVTACVVAALGEAGADAGDDSIRVLLSARRSDGFFHTWIRDRGPNDVDAVVNANVAWALQERAPREVAAWLGEVVARRAERESMHYYDDPMVLHRAIVRAHRAGAPGLDAVAADIRERLLSEYAGADALSLALRLAALVELGAEVPHAILDALLATQRDDGSWPWCPAWSGPEPPRSRELYWGSEALTTAVAVEALSGALGRY